MIIFMLLIAAIWLCCSLYKLLIFRFSSEIKNINMKKELITYVLKKYFIKYPQKKKLVRINFLGMGVFLTSFIIYISLYLSGVMNVYMLLTTAIMSSVGYLVMLVLYANTLIKAYANILIEDKNKLLNITELDLLKIVRKQLYVTKIYVRKVIKLIIPLVIILVLVIFMMNN